MPKPFHRLSLDEFARVLASFPFSRRIDSVHLHHTWKPSHADWAGLRTVEGMWRYHTQEKRWSDIAQHVTIDPEGGVWTGRNWNWSPASSEGFNGNWSVGPFMIEMVGNFDAGRDVYGHDQRDAAREVVARVQKLFGLSPDSLRFHNSMADRTCPGSAIDYEAEVEAITELHGTLVAIDGGGRLAPLADERRRADRVIRDLNASSRAASRAGGAAGELDCGDIYRASSARGGGGLLGSKKLSPEQLQAIRPHVVNMSNGQLSDDGDFTTGEDDIRALFDQSLGSALEAAKAFGRPLRIVLYAHGGLVNERKALVAVDRYAPWWRANHIYPIFFVWETGLWTTIGQLITGAWKRGTGGSRGARGLSIDWLIEPGVRRLGGPRIWAGMKKNAERSSAVGGGAELVAAELTTFCKKNAGDVELHAVGHSAGSNFHSYFLPRLLADKKLTIKTLHLLAPAIRVDDYLDRVAPLMGSRIEKTAIFTMTKAFEKDDTVTLLYRKSLLYLIYKALEDEENIDLLGLEESLRRDSQTRRLFGLAGGPSDIGEAIFSKTPTVTGTRASQATTHGGFDDDKATMESVARRILGLRDTDDVEAFPVARGLSAGERAGSTADGTDPWDDDIEWPEELTLVPSGWSADPGGVKAGSPSVFSSSGPSRLSGGRCRALCVGINAYRERPLTGCVADAWLWAQSLRRLDFADADITMLLNGDATRSAIVQALGDLVKEGSRRGDVIVFQFAGHGTYLPDLSGDEKDGFDEAFCPVDYDRGAYLLDDDVGEIFDRAPEGVNLTCFIDCCHSGSISRLGARAIAAPSPTARARFLATHTRHEEAHRDFRSRLGEPTSVRSRDLVDIPEVVFSACQDRELAWEDRGQGDFTRKATSLLVELAGRETHEGFERRVVQAFGPRRKQTPNLWCHDTARGRTLLEPLS